jgi:hypothetical protein
MNNQTENGNSSDVVERELIMYSSDKLTPEKASEIIWIATGFDVIQCEQLAQLIYSKGFATIKIGDIDELIPMSETILLDGFKTNIV